MAKFEVKGIDKLREQFKKLSELEVKQSLLKGALYIQRETQENHDYQNITGFLQSSPESTVTEEGAQVEYSADYSYYVELKKPYVRPFLDENEAEIIQVISEDLQERINKEVG